MKRKILKLFFLSFLTTIIFLYPLLTQDSLIFMKDSLEIYQNRAKEENKKLLIFKRGHCSIIIDE
jgi:hypothetical protein